MKKELSQLTKDEKSLLLFFETVCVDYGGKLNPQHMNGEDMEIAQRWTKEDFVEFNRIASKFLSTEKTHSVTLSENAWKLAHEERKARFNRIYSKREWLTVTEYRGCPIK